MSKYENFQKEIAFWLDFVVTIAGWIVVVGYAWRFIDDPVIPLVIILFILHVNQTTLDKYNYDND